VARQCEAARSSVGLFETSSRVVTCDSCFDSCDGPSAIVEHIIRSDVRNVMASDPKCQRGTTGRGRELREDNTPSFLLLATNPSGRSCIGCGGMTVGLNSDARSTPVLRVGHLQQAIHMTPIGEIMSSRRAHLYSTLDWTTALLTSSSTGRLWIYHGDLGCKGRRLCND
jgi:hypothetical protein